MQLKRLHGRDKWLAAKRKFIGASESPVLLGQGYAGVTRATLFADHVAGHQSRKPSIAMRLGQNCEPGVIATANEELKLEIKPLHYTVCVSKERKYVGCSPDGVVEYQGLQCPAEVKNLSRWGSMELDEGPLPLKYQIQMQHQMYCCDAQHCLFVANLANDDLLHRWEPRNDEFIQNVLLPAIDEFWGFIQRRECPPESDPFVYSDVLTRLFPREKTEAITLPESMLELMARRDAADAAEKEAARVKKEIDCQLKLALGEACAGVLPDGRYVSWKTIERDGYTVEPKTYRDFRIHKQVPKGVTVV